MTYTKEERAEDMEQERMEDAKGELKTLKDILPEFESESSAKKFYLVYGGLLRELKAEAVKWVKELKGEWNGKLRADWIKHFFNITEKEVRK